MIAETVTRWPHQERMLRSIVAALEAGERAVCVTSPTGSGKTLVQMDVIDWAASAGHRVLLLTNRRMLLAQTHSVAKRAGIEHGLMAAGYAPDLDANVQIANLQTITSRVYRTCRWQLPEAQVVIVDEAHQQTADEAKRVLKDFRDAGATIVGFTATPVDVGGVYDRLLVGATKRELIQQGLLVPAHCYAPDEPDLKKCSTNARGEFVQEEMVKRIMVGEVVCKDGQRKAIYRPRIFGRVLEHYHTLNPDRLPTVLFAPGVQESIWFAAELQKHGITTAHIDAETPDEDRQRIAHGSQSGDIEVVCNRFVLREAVDWPWLRHGIFACAMGQYSTWCQMAGRLLRRYDGKTQCTVQDHGGNYYRFGAYGSPNRDYPWTLEETDKSVSDRVNTERHSLETKEQEPIVCPQCTGCRIGGSVCPHCGFRCDKSVRNVVQTSGKLKKVEDSTGEVGLEERRYKARRRAWTAAMFAAWNAELTFKQAHSIYSRKVKSLTGEWPPASERHWLMPDGHPNAPNASIDWTRKVRVVQPQLGKNRVKA